MSARGESNAIPAMKSFDPVKGDLLLHPALIESAIAGPVVPA
jgi:hypothetical protein